MLRARQKIGKYKIVRCLSKGPLAHVYQAFDTVLGERVALKIPTSAESVGDFIREVRLANRLAHPNILPVRDASFIGERFVVVTALGKESLADRIERRISRELAMALARQALDAVAFAHSHKLIHCDIKPENFILFADNKLKLADFGFAKISLRTLKASGSGTIDYIAPEQAMGRPMFQSDVFSLGLVLCRLLGGRLPEWPFDWPPPGIERMKKWLTADQVAILKKSIQVDPQQRFASAVAMRNSFERSAKQRRHPAARKTSGKTAGKTPPASWKKVQWKEFRRRYGRALELKHSCRKCAGPVAEYMQACPWCRADNPARNGETTMPALCPRCERGVKLDWRYCAWCYGRGFEVRKTRRYSDRRYTSRCSKPACRGPLMPFMKYCPWCRSKVQQKWKLGGGARKCRGCGSEVAEEFWDFCAWCARRLSQPGRAARASGKAG